MDIKFGGAILRLPDEAPPEAIQKAIEHFRTTPEFDKLIDKERGAPARVRMMVGSAPQQDRLANLKRFYPDAVPYGDDNFVFSDPETGKPILYNPLGLDFGDAASFMRETSQMIGGGLGAVAGAPFGGPIGSAGGAGLGAAAGGLAFDAVMGLQGRVDSRSDLQRVLDSTVDFGANAVGQRIGELFGYGIKRALGAGTSKAKHIYQQFQKIGVTNPPAGATTGSRSIGGVEKMLEGIPTTAAKMQEQAEVVVAQVQAAADDLARQFGPVLDTGQEIGTVLKQGVKRSHARFSDRNAAQFDEAFDLVGSDTPVALDNVVGLLNTMRSELAKAPRSLEGKLGPAMRMLEQLAEDAGNGGIPFDALRQVRTMIGKEMDAPMLAQSAPVAQQGLKRIYGALSQDLTSAAQAASPEAAAKLHFADRYMRLWMQNSQELMKKLDSYDAPERAFTWAFQQAHTGGTSLSRLRGLFEPEEWDQVAASVLARMGKAKPGAQDASGDAFSVATFLTNWNKLAPEAKKALFSGKRYAGLAENLDALVEATASLKNVERLANSSNSGNVFTAYATMSVIGGVIGQMSSGDTTGAAQGAVIGLAGPWAAAKLITNPRFVAWLASPITKPGAIGPHMARLTAIAEAEPEIKEEIWQFIEALRESPEPQ